MWPQGAPVPSMVYQCRAWCTCFHPLRVMCVYQLKAMFSLGLGEGLVPRVDCTGQDWRMFLVELSWASGNAGMALPWVP